MLTDYSMPFGIIYVRIWNIDRIISSVKYESVYLNVSNIESIIESKICPNIDLLVNDSKLYNSCEKLSDCKLQYIVQDEVGFLVCAMKDFQHRICFQFLTWLVKEYEMNKYNLFSKYDQNRFNEIIHNEMMRYSMDKEIDKIVSVQHKVNDVKNMLEENMHDLLGRGEKLEVLDEKSRLLETKAQVFNEEAKDMRCKICMENKKRTIILISVIMLVYMFFVFFVGVGLFFVLRWYTNIL